MSWPKEVHCHPKAPPPGERAMIIRAIVGVSAALLLGGVYALVTGQRRMRLTQLKE